MAASTSSIVRRRTLFASSLVRSELGRVALARSSWHGRFTSSVAARERRDDILELAHYFLSRHRVARPLRLSPEASDALLRYEWPGNVRELERLIERIVTLATSDVMGLEDLPPLVGGPHLAALGPSLTQNETMRGWARRYARIVLARQDGNKRATARALGISYHTLQAYLRAELKDDVAAEVSDALELTASGT
jgi:DNA-binding NtrC family response regulator